MLWEPIENRYRKEKQVFHSSAFAIAAGVVGVAGAATSAGMAMSSASKAAKAQGAASKKMQQKTNKATKQFNQQQAQLRSMVEAIDPTINIPEYNLKNATAEGIEAANKVTANTIKQVQGLTGRNPQELFDTLAGWERRLGDQYAQVQGGVPLIEQQQEAISGMIRGELPQVTQEQIMRTLAERGGAGFSMQAAGRGPFIQSPQAMLAENIRQSSEERMRAGLALAPGIIEQRRGVAGTALGLSEGARGIFGTWMDAAQGFIQSPTQMMALGLQGRGQDINVAEANIRNRMRQAEMIGGINLGQFQAATGQAERIYGLNQANIEASLARDQATAQGVQGITSAASGALGGIGSAYGQIAMAQGGGMTGFGGQTYVPKTSATGGAYYAPKSGSIF